MNILVIGLGSMGKRRIRLIKELYPNYKVYGVDGRMDRREEASKLFNIQCKSTICEAKENFEIDASFVCTSPLSHNQIINECLNNKWNVFTELNLISDGYEDNIHLAKANGCVLFLSSTFFYREEIRYIKEHISFDQKWNYIYHIGQYLPDWHPWENYKDYFVGDKRTNGCREIMAIELPWIIKTFGSVDSFTVISDRMTGLKIDYNDNYMIQLTHENGSKGVLVVDVVSPVAVRRLEVLSENKYYQWNGTPDTLYEYSKEIDKLIKVSLHEREEHIEGYRAFVVENAYKNEINEFVDVVENGKKQLYGFEEDLKVLELIDKLEE